MDKTINIEVVTDILKKKAAEIRRNYDKVKAVEPLLNNAATESKKMELLNMLFVVQDIQHEVLDAYTQEFQRRINADMFTKMREG